MRVKLSAFLLPAALLAATTARAQTEVTVQASTVQSLDAKLQAFAQGLTPAERAAWTTVLRQAAGAPADNPAGVAVRPTFYPGGTPGTPGAVIRTGPDGGIIVQGGRTAAQGIVVQGGRTGAQGIVVQGGRGTTPAPATRTGAVSIGPKQEDPARGRTAVSIGPKQEDPARGRTGITAIGPKPEDPTLSLDAKVHAFAATLTGDEQATFDWLLQRAAAHPGMPGPGGMPSGPAMAAQGQPGPGGMPARRVMATQGQRGPGGLPAGAAPSLSQALGVVAIGPKPEDPTTPPPADLRVRLRF